MPSQELIASTIEAGRISAQEVTAFRDQELKKRARVIAAQKAGFRTLVTLEEVPDPAVRPQSLATLVAEGDSWFDYPMHDVLRCLEDHHGYDVEAISHRGDRVEHMAYADGELEEFARRLEKVLRREIVPRAILLSGGGNDLAGSEFGMLLNHFESTISGLNESILRGVIDERIKLAYVFIISKITSVCERRISRRLPIVIHGYDYPVPDGRGFLGGAGFLPGPWLEPGFRDKGFAHLQQRRSLAMELIDRFNGMLQEVAAIDSFEHVRYLDLRGTLRNSNYKVDWANELHPTAKGFEVVAKRFAEELNSLS